MSDLNRNRFGNFNDTTVVIKPDEVEQQLASSSDETVLDTARGSLFDPELEAILRETEGYEFEPEPVTDEAPASISSGNRREVSDNARRVIEEQADKKREKSKKRWLFVCAGIVVVLAILFAGMMIMKNGGQQRSYQEAYDAAERYYNDGDYDRALEKLREAMGIKKTDECLLLMSYCYEAKYDYANAIAILESSTTDNPDFKKRIEELKIAKEEFESGKIVVICGEKYDVETTTLDLSKKGIRSGRLDEVSKLRNLKTLKLADNEITTLDFLKGMNSLESLDLSGNEISDISVLAGLVNLRTLHLDDNKIEDFTPLYELKNLTMLTISGMDIKESQLKELKEKLPDCIIYSDEADMDIVEVKLGGKTFKSDVKELDLSGREITDISVLSVCTKLTKLNLSGNSISDISALVDIPNLKSLDLSDNNISDIGPLMSMTGLEYLNLANNRISSASALADLKNLSELQLGGNTLKGIKALAKLTGLKTLGLDNTGLTDTALSNLYGLKNLKKLNIENNPELSENAVSELEKKLGGCTVRCSEFAKKTIELGGKSFAVNAETVEAKGLGISDISKAAGFTAVRNLDLSGNSISNLAPLSGLKTLESLDLSDNAISDVKALYSLKNLRQLWLKGNDLSAEQIDALRAALPDCSITVE